MNILRKIFITKYNWSLWVPGIFAGILLKSYSIPLSKIVDGSYFLIQFLVLVIPATNIIVIEILHKSSFRKFLNVLLIALSIYPFWLLTYMEWIINSEILIVFVIPIIIFSFLLLIKNFLIIATYKQSNFLDKIFLGFSLVFIGFFSWILITAFLTNAIEVMR